MTSISSKSRILDKKDGKSLECGFPSFLSLSFLFIFKYSLSNQVQHFLIETSYTDFELRHLLGLLPIQTSV